MSITVQIYLINLMWLLWTLRNMEESSTGVEALKLFSVMWKRGNSSSSSSSSKNNNDNNNNNKTRKTKF